VPQHVEFSISDPHQPRAAAESDSTLDRWGATVDGAAEPCLVIDTQVTVVAISAAFEEMLGLGEDESPVSRPLDAVLQFSTSATATRSSSSR